MGWVTSSFFVASFIVIVDDFSSSTFVMMVIDIFYNYDRFYARALSQRASSYFSCVLILVRRS